MKKNSMNKEKVVFSTSFDTIEELSKKSLSDYTVSSTVTFGPLADITKWYLESLNDACIGNDPKTVEQITNVLLENRLTFYAEISKMEIILARTKAVTLLDPNIKAKDYFNYLVNTYYRCSSIS